LSDLLGLDGENYTEGNEASSDVDNRLNEAVAAQQAAEEALRFKNQELKNSDAKLLKAQRKSDLLNQQVLSLRQELAEIEELLAISQEKSTESDAQLQNLGNRLNAALARAASEQRRRLKLEEAERQRLEAEKTTIDNERKRLEALANDLQNDKVRWSAREKVINKQLRELRKSLEEALTRAAMEQAKRLKLEQQLVD
jgi:chemotaxis protein MotB